MDMTKNLRARLKKIGASSAQIARDSGVSQTNVSRILRGSIPRVDTYERLTAYLKRFETSAIQMVEIKPIRPTSKVPSFATAGANAVDLHADIEDPCVIESGTTRYIPTGIAVQSGRDDLAMLLLPRSGLGAKHGFVLANTVGLIDSDYQGEIIVSATIRHGMPGYTVEPGERIAQLMFIKTERPCFAVVDDFSAETERGAGGFGSSGK